MVVCLVKQDGRSSVEGQPQQMAVCLVKQDGRSSTVFFSREETYFYYPRVIKMVFIAQNRAIKTSKCDKIVLKALCIFGIYYLHRSQLPCIC